MDGRSAANEPMQREFPTAPIVGVGAVVLDSEQRILLVRRGQPPLEGEWSLPGGALELGERLEDGIRREVAEETGLAVTPLELVAVFDHISHADDAADQRVRFHYVLVDYRCRLDGGSLACASDAVDARWVRWEELDGPDQTSSDSEVTAGGRLRLNAFTRSVIRKALDQAGAATLRVQNGVNL
jgi:8-oxo-dGTP diphosphatase